MYMCVALCAVELPHCWDVLCLGVDMGCCRMIRTTQNEPVVPVLRQIHHESCQCTALIVFILQLMWEIEISEGVPMSQSDFRSWTRTLKLVCFCFRGLKSHWW